MATSTDAARAARLIHHRRRNRLHSAARKADYAGDIERGTRLLRATYRAWKLEQRALAALRASAGRPSMDDALKSVGEGVYYTQGNWPSALKIVREEDGAGRVRWGIYRSGHRIGGGHLLRIAKEQANRLRMFEAGCLVGVPASVQAMIDRAPALIRRPWGGR